MKFIYPTELSWLMHREQVKENGFFARDGRIYTCLFLDSDEKMNGFDLYQVGQEIAMTKWKRAEIAAQVEEETRMKSLSEAQAFFEWLSEHIEEMAE